MSACKITVILEFTAAGIAPLAQPPAALLPCGPVTLLERQFRQFAVVGTRQIHVLSDLPIDAHPEVAHQASQLGIELHWHMLHPELGKLPALLSLGLPPDEPVILGCASHWLSDAFIERLVLLATHQEPQTNSKLPPGWCASRMTSLLHEVKQSEAPFIACTTPIEPTMTAQCHPVCSALDLLHANMRVCDTPGNDVPATWIQHPWGYASPTALISPQARIQGPVHIGPGCMIGPEVSLGPGVVLAKNVIVSRNARIRRSVVLSDTYIAKDLELDEAIVRGADLFHTRLQSHLCLPAADGLLLDTHPSSVDWQESVLLLAGRLTAHALSMVLALLQLLVHPIITIGLLSDQTAARHNARQRCNWWSLHTQLQQICQRKKRWFGVRQRTHAELESLTPAWAQTLKQAPTGMFVFPTHEELNPTLSTEQLGALADLYWLSQQSWKQRWDMCRHGWQTILADNKKARILKTRA